MRCKSLRLACALGAETAARYARQGIYAVRVDDRSAWDTPLRDNNFTLGMAGGLHLPQFLLQFAYFVAQPGGQFEL